MGSRNWCKPCGQECKIQDNNDEHSDGTRTAFIAVGAVLAITLTLGVAGFGLWRYWWLPSQARQRHISTAAAAAPDPKPHAPLVVASAGTSLSGGSSSSVATVSTLGAATEGFGAVAIPGNWTTTAGITIIPDPDKVPEVQRIMSATWRQKGTRDRKGAEVPTDCRVVNVLRVEHHKTWEKYSNHKASLRWRFSNDKAGGCPAFPVLTDDQGLSSLDADVNEMYLFHGTTPAAAEKIAKDDFKVRLAGSRSGAMFGMGIYLAESASKSDEYASEGTGVYVGLYAMLLCRAAAGRVLTVLQPGDYTSQMRREACDSLCGDRLAAVGTFREMIFPAEGAVYTEYIALYARVYDRASTGSG